MFYKSSKRFSNIVELKINNQDCWFLDGMGLATSIMKHSLPSEISQKLVKRNQYFMTLYYTSGALLFLYNAYSIGEITIESIIMIIGVLALPFAWRYFDKNFKKKILSEFEVNEAELLTLYKENIISRTPLKSIRKISENKAGANMKLDTGNRIFLDKRLYKFEELVKSINTN